jgi:preprotein translocase subunit SecD
MRRGRPNRLTVVLIVVVFGAGCGSDKSNVQAPATTTEQSAAPTTSAAPGPSPTTAVAAVLSITLAPSRTLTGGEQTAAVTRLRGRAAALGYDAQVSTTSGGQLLVAIRGIDQADSDRIAAGLTAITGNIYLRPVLTDDQFGLPCATGADSQAAPAATTESLPPVAADSSGYVATAGGGLCKLGPAGGSGAVFVADAQAVFTAGTGWAVTVSLKPGPTGEGVWNTLATDCYNATATCPTRQLAIELDGLVISAPTVQTPEFFGTVQITGTFTEAEAGALADVVNVGALDYSVTVVGTQYITP